jgi:hypothetical protein
MVSGIGSSGGVYYTPPPGLNSEQKQCVNEAANAIEALVKQVKADKFVAWDDQTYGNATAKLTAATEVLVTIPESGKPFDSVVGNAEGFVNAALSIISGAPPSTNSCNKLLEIAEKLRQVAR